MKIAPLSICVTLVVALLLVAEGARAEPPCPTNCTCVGGLQLEYACDTPAGSFEAYLQPAHFLKVECQEPAALEPVAALPPLANSTLLSAELDACGPPRAGWAATLRALGVAGTLSLVLRAPEPPDPPDGLEPFWRPEHFAGLEDLQALTLKGGGPAPPRLLAGLTGLQRLTLSNIPLRLGDALPLPRGGALRWLELGGAALSELPARGFAGAPGLRGLVVLGGGARGAGKEVRAAAAALEGLPGLDTLQLRGVALGTLPPRWLAAAAGALRTARLERCALREVPDSLLAGAARLQNLSLAENALQALPATLLAGLPALRRLELQGNRLAALPPALLLPARRLLYLDLSNNRLERLDDSTFASQSELQTLILSFNNLSFAESTVPGGPGDPGGDAAAAFGPFSAPSPLAGLGALRELHVAHNRVAALPDDWRFRLPALARLDLSYNAFRRLTDADVNIVVSAEDLELDLRYNNISSVELLAPDPAAWGGGGPRVLLAGNPLRCDCHLHPLLRRAAFRLQGARCAAPPELRGRALPELPPALLRCALPAPACPAACACELRPGLAGGLLQLACAAPPAARAWPDPAAYGLPASALRLTAPPPDSPEPLALPPHCRDLSLAGLRLARAPRAPAGLPLLDLSDNSLRELPEELAAANGTRLLLAGNPWRCDCAAARSVARLRRAAERVDDWAALRCADGAPLAGARAAPCPAAAWPALAALAAVAALGALLSAAAALRYARELRGWAAARGLACCWPADPADADADAEAGAPDERFDAFVSYAHADEAWVVGELVPRLERAGLRLCVHFRDWPAGGWIPAQIERSVRQSRRTLLVVSQHYLCSEWAQHEWRAALSRPRPRLVLVLLGRLAAGGAALPPELRAHMARHTYVKVGDPWFWSKLRVALPRHPVKPPEPAERQRRDVTRKLGFDDRLEALCAAPPAAPAAAAAAAAQDTLLARLDPAALDA